MIVGIPPCKVTNLKCFFSPDIAVSVRNVTARSIVLNFTIEDAVKEFVVKWQRYRDAPEETLRTKRSLVIFGLSPNILYTINITVHLRDGQEKASVVNVSTNGKWYWYWVLSFWLEL